MEEKPKYSEYKPKKKGPLFIRFANDQVSKEEIIDGLIEATKDEATREIATQAKESDYDLSQFREDFREMLVDVIANGVYHPAANYVNSYMEPSLLQHMEESSTSSTGTQKRWVSVRRKDAPWVEALVCYNFSLFVKLYSHRKIKVCPNCKSFFVNQKFDYKYCSETCKVRSDG